MTSPSLASEFVVIRKRFPSVVNSLESLGFLSVLKAYHQIVSVTEDNDDRISLNRLRSIAVRIKHR